MKNKTEIEIYVKEQICKTLKEKGISAYQLGMVGIITPKTVYNALDGKTKPSLEMLELIVNATGISMGEFFKEYDEMYLKRQHFPAKDHKAQKATDIDKPAELEGMVSFVKRLNSCSSEVPVYIIHSAGNKELYLVAKLETDGSFNDGIEEIQHLILKDRLGVHS